jgi:tetratricopeptide (TPR) repeat protein
VKNWNRSDIIAVLSLIITFLSYLAAIRSSNILVFEDLLGIGWVSIISLLVSISLLMAGSYIYWHKRNLFIDSKNDHIKTPTYSKKIRNIAAITMVMSLFVSAFGLFLWPYHIKSSAGEFIDLGLSSLNKGQFDKANLYLTRAVELKPDKITKSLAFSVRGQVSYFKNDYSQALADLNQSIALNPNLSIAYYSRGRVHLEQGNKIMGYNPSYFEVAVIDFSQAISLKPDFVEAYYARGLAYSVLPHSDHLSRSDFKKVLEISKDPKLLQEASLRLK